MKAYVRRTVMILTAVTAAVIAQPGATARAQYPLLAQMGAGTETPEQRVAALKSWLQESRAQMRHYQWIETTVVTENGEEKSREQVSCYYGVDGGLQKVPVAGAYEKEAGGGPLRKRLAARKDENTKQYLEEGAALIHSYIPPDPSRIQNVVASGGMAVEVLEPGKRVRLNFRDYLKPGDVLGVEIELATNRLLGMRVSSYLDDPSDAIGLDVDMGLLPDGTIYIQRSTLTAPAKNVVVTIENTGFRSAG